MHKLWLKIAALLGALSVALGAFGAHALKEILSTDALNTFETALKYQFIHTLVLFIMAFNYKQLAPKQFLWSARFFALGILFFSGSLYLLLTIKHLQIQGLGWIGAITPLGGIFFIIGWLFIAIAASNK